MPNLSQVTPEDIANLEGQINTCEAFDGETLIMFTHDEATRLLSALREGQRGEVLDGVLSEKRMSISDKTNSEHGGNHV